MPVTQKEKLVALQIVEQVLTEENTDALIEIIVKRVKKVLPFWAKWLPIGTVLDKLFPDVLIDALRELLTA